MRIRTLLAGLAILLAGALPAQAISVTMSEMSTATSVQVDLTISGLGSGATPSLGAWDIDLVYDATRLSFVSSTFTDQLGDAGLFEVIQGQSVAGGVIDAFQVSFLDPTALDASQDPSFVFYSVRFDRLENEETTISLTQLILSNELGAGIRVPVVPSLVVPLSEVVPPDHEIIPEPGAALLFGVGLLVLERGRRRRSSAPRG